MLVTTTANQQYWPNQETGCAYSVSAAPCYYPPHYATKIRKVENGFVLKHDGDDYAFESIESLLKFLKEKLKG